MSWTRAADPEDSQVCDFAEPPVDIARVRQGPNIMVAGNPHAWHIDPCDDLERGFDFPAELPLRIREAPVRAVECLRREIADHQDAAQVIAGERIDDRLELLELAMEVTDHSEGHGRSTDVTGVVVARRVGHAV